MFQCGTVFDKYYIQTHDLNSGVDNFILQCTSLKGLNVQIPEFYKTYLQEWFKLIAKTPIASKESILNQNLFRNSKIAYKNNSLFLFNWTQNNLKKLKTSGMINIGDWKDYATMY